MTRGLVLASAAYLAALAILLGLGTWQVQRLAWKEALIARVESRFHAPAVPLPEPPAWGDADFLDRFEYRPVAVTGEFVTPDPAPADFRRFYTYTLLAEPRGPAGGQGYFVMNLFRPETGGAIYLNRGFVPRGREGTEAPPPAGRVTVTGVVRRASSGNAFTPPCETEHSVCYVADIAEAARLIGEAGVAPFYVDLEASFTPPGGAPQAGETRVRFPNNHLQYAVTWYGLAAALTGVFAVSLWQRRRRPGQA